MNEIRAVRVIQFFFTAALYILIAKSLIVEYGILQGLHVTFLMWSFFVLCLPVARGTILFGVPFQLFTHKRLFMPEVISWCLALVGNIASLKVVPSIYLKTNITHLLFCILNTPWPYWLIIGTCASATFFTAFSRNFTNRRLRAFGELLLFCSFTTTFILAYTEFVIVLNAHGHA